MAKKTLAPEKAANNETERKPLPTPAAQQSEAKEAGPAAKNEHQIGPGQVVVADAINTELQFVTTRANWDKIYSKSQRDGAPRFILLAEKKR